MCAQSLRCLKSKYLSFFSAQWVSRYLDRDVTIGLASSSMSESTPSSLSDKCSSRQMISSHSTSFLMHACQRSDEDRQSQSIIAAGKRGRSCRRTYECRRFGKYCTNHLGIFTSQLPQLKFRSRILRRGWGAGGGVWVRLTPGQLKIA